GACPPAVPAKSAKSAPFGALARGKQGKMGVEEKQFVGREYSRFRSGGSGWFAKPMSINGLWKAGFFTSR
ncbi:MAG TPA: hypothetical protein VHR72_10130, partial [Gemmataceae bacterium]|nr:hypothetical protein [Gemmataceae bacterium]